MPSRSAGSLSSGVPGPDGAGPGADAIADANRPRRVQSSKRRARCGPRATLQRCGAGPETGARPGRNGRFRPSEPHLAPNSTHQHGADSGNTSQILGRLEAAQALPILDDASGENRSDPRDLLQFLDLCPIHIHERRGTGKAGGTGGGRASRPSRPEFQMGRQGLHRLRPDPGNACEVSRTFERFPGCPLADDRLGLRSPDAG